MNSSSSRYLTRMSRRSVLGAGLFVGTSLLIKSCRSGGSSDPAAETPEVGEVVASTFPGSWEEAHRTILAEYFQTTTGNSVSLVPLLAVDQIAQLTAAPDSPPYDVVIMDEGPLRTAPIAEIIQPFPADMSKTFGELLPQYQNAEEGWGPTIAVQAIGLGYNTERITTPPTSWEDLWKPEYTGRVGLVSMQSTVGTAFMVQLARMRGGGEDNIDPAFEAIQELLPNVAAIAPNPGALSTLFQQGEVDIAPHYLNNVAPLAADGSPVDWAVPSEGAMLISPSMHVVKNPRSRELAVTYIDAAMSTEVQTKMASAPYYFVPTNRNVQIPGFVGERLGRTTEEVVDRLIPLDWAKISENLPTWIERFNREVAV
ncbi:MAG: ABC transporter substrate-binding protein [Thainema sp.]